MMNRHKFCLLSSSFGAGFAWAASTASSDILTPSNNSRGVHWSEIGFTPWRVDCDDRGGFARHASVIEGIHPGFG